MARGALLLFCLCRRRERHDTLEFSISFSVAVRVEPERARSDVRQPRNFAFVTFIGGDRFLAELKVVNGNVARLVKGQAGFLAVRPSLGRHFSIAGFALSCANVGGDAPIR